MGVLKRNTYPLFRRQSQLGGVVLLQLLSVVGGLRSDKRVVVSEDFIQGEFAILKAIRKSRIGPEMSAKQNTHFVVISNSDQMAGLSLGVVESNGHNPVPHLVLRKVNEVMR